jgi:hypothetical protein
MFFWRRFSPATCFAEAHGSRDVYHLKARLALGRTHKILPSHPSTPLPPVQSPPLTRVPPRTTMESYAATEQTALFITSIEEGKSK